MVAQRQNSGLSPFNRESHTETPGDNMEHDFIIATILQTPEGGQFRTPQQIIGQKLARFSPKQQTAIIQNLIGQARHDTEEQVMGVAELWQYACLHSLWQSAERPYASEEEMRNTFNHTLDLNIMLNAHSAFEKKRESYVRKLKQLWKVETMEQVLPEDIRPPLFSRTLLAELVKLANLEISHTQAIQLLRQAGLRRQATPSRSKKASVQTLDISTVITQVRAASSGKIPPSEVTPAPSTPTSHSGIHNNGDTFLPAICEEPRRAIERAPLTPTPTPRNTSTADRYPLGDGLLALHLQSPLSGITVTEASSISGVTGHPPPIDCPTSSPLGTSVSGILSGIRFGLFGNKLPSKGPQRQSEDPFRASLPINPNIMAQDPLLPQNDAAEDVEMLEGGSGNPPQQINTSAIAELNAQEDHDEGEQEEDGEDEQEDGEEDGQEDEDDEEDAQEDEDDEDYGERGDEPAARERMRDTVAPDSLDGPPRLSPSLSNPRLVPEEGSIQPHEDCACHPEVKDHPLWELSPPSLGDAIAVSKDLMDAFDHTQICEMHTKSLSQILGLRTIGSLKALQARLCKLCTTGIDLHQFTKDHATWFRKDVLQRELTPNENEGPYRYEFPETSQGVPGFDANILRADLLSPVQIREWEEDGIVILRGFLDYMLARPEVRAMEQEILGMYSHHQALDPEGNTAAMALMVYTPLQQCFRQDPMAFCLNVAMAPDASWRLLSFPTAVTVTAAGDGQETLEMQVPLRDFVNEQVGKNRIGASLVLDDESVQGCTTVVRGFHKQVGRWYEGILAKNQKIPAGQTTDCTSLYTAEDSALYGPPRPVRCEAGDLRLTQPSIICGRRTAGGATGRSIQSHYTGIDPDGETLTTQGLPKLRVLRQMHITRQIPAFLPHGGRNRHPCASTIFPATTLICGETAVGDALQGLRAWDDWEVIAERNILLGPDRVAAKERIVSIRSKLYKAYCRAVERIREVEQAAFGKDSYFRKITREMDGFDDDLLMDIDGW